MGALTSYKLKCALRCCQTGPTVYRLYPRRLVYLNNSQMKLERQHFLLCYLKTLSVGPVGV